MRTRGIFLFIVIVLGLVGARYFLSINQNNTANMTITSPLFRHNEKIPSKYTCDGENVNPPLEFQNIPAGAKSLVLIMDDPDAPRGTWVHWTLWNMDAGAGGITEHSVPAGAVEGATSYGAPGYRGPCPPSGTHRYFFKLYALDTALDLAPDSDKAALLRALEGHIVEQAEFIGLYQRG